MVEAPVDGLPTSFVYNWNSAKELLPVHSKIEFVFMKDKMKFTLNGEKYEYRVVSEEALEATADAGSH